MVSVVAGIRPSNASRTRDAKLKSTQFSARALPALRRSKPFVLTKYRPHDNLPRMIRQLTRDLLRHYPQIYFACHLEHTRARTNPHGLTDRDIVLLGHLDELSPLRAGPLARHLGVRPSTLSAQLQRLEKLGHLTRTASRRDRRQVELRLTARGAASLATTSILDPGRVNLLLMTLTPSERTLAVGGLALLARAARQLQHRNPKQLRLT
jgi:DNA-binding MarR family transcriptional regulator